MLKVVLVGFGLKTDLARLALTLPEYFDQGRAPYVIELSDVGGTLLSPGNAGLSWLAAACLGGRIDKSQQCSSWAVRPLTEVQLHYAALDARVLLWIVQAIYGALQREWGLAGSPSEVFEPWSRPLPVAKASACRTTHRVQALKHTDVMKALEGFELTPHIEVMRVNTAPQSCQLVKTLGLQLYREDGSVSLVVCVLDIDRRLDLGCLALHMKLATKSRLALSQQLVELFGYIPGTLGPIGLRKQSETIVVVDSMLMGCEKILCGAGEQDLLYAICPKLIVDTLKASVGDIACSIR